MDWDKYLNRRARTAGLSASFQELLQIQVALLQLEDQFAVSAPEPPAKALPRDLKERLQSGVPLINTADLTPEVSFAGYFQSLLDLLARYRRADVETVRNKLQSGALDIGGAAREVLRSSADSARHQGPDDFLRYLLWRAWKAQLRRQAEAWTAALSKAKEEGLSGDTDATGVCPICGTIPDLAVLKDDGQRFLHCSLCGYYWLFPRLVCPFCQTDVQDELGYFEADAMPKVRINFCRVCKGYIKTFDLRESAEEFQPELEQILSLQLDLQAEQEGFRPGGNIANHRVSTIIV